VLDCRLCGDPNSKLRFGFIAFATFEEVDQALTLDGFVLEAGGAHIYQSLLPFQLNFAPFKLVCRLKAHLIVPIQLNSKQFLSHESAPETTIPPTTTEMVLQLS